MFFYGLTCPLCCLHLKRRKIRKFSCLICHLVVWSIWLLRNDIVYNGGKCDLISTLGIIKLNSFLALVSGGEKRGLSCSFCLTWYCMDPISLSFLGLKALLAFHGKWVGIPLVLPSFCYLCLYTYIYKQRWKWDRRYTPNEQKRKDCEIVLLHVSHGGEVCLLLLLALCVFFGLSKSLLFRISPISKLSWISIVLTTLW